MTSELIHFRIIACPLCNHQVCWVNHRLPSFCPECGGRIYGLLKQSPGRILISDEQASIRYDGR